MTMPIDDIIAEADKLREQYEGGEKEKPRESIANRLVKIGKEADLFHDERRDGYAVVRNGDASMTVRLRGRDFRRWLAGQYWARFQAAPNNDAIQTAIGVLESMAVFEGRDLRLSNRFAYRDNEIFIDLADARWRVVKVTADGWDVLDARAALFRRYSHQRPLPVPVRGGKLDELDEFLNFRSADDLLLLRAWLTTASLEDIPRPIVTFYGAQGGGKSTAGRVLRSLLDPSAVDNLSFPRKHDELAQMLDHHAVPNFDNLKTVDSASSDMLCRAVTGGGFSKRELFSDADDVIFTFKRPLILNGINIPTHAPDLLDRMMLFELERIPEDKRRTESEFWRAFDKAHPRLFGALLDAMVLMLLAQPQAQNKLPRMADFAAWGARWAHGAQIGATRFLDAYSQIVGRQTEEAIESDDLALAIRSLVQGEAAWSGTPAELLKVLNAQRGDAPVPDGWPRKANSLGRRLRVLQTTLSQIGIRVAIEHSGSRKITLSKDPPEKPSKPSKPSDPNNGGGFEADGIWTVPSQTDQTVQQPSNRKANTGAGLDGLDDMDDISGYFTDDPDKPSDEDTVEQATPPAKTRDPFLDIDYTKVYKRGSGNLYADLPPIPEKVVRSWADSICKSETLDDARRTWRSMQASPQLECAVHKALVGTPEWGRCVARLDPEGHA